MKRLSHNAINVFGLAIGIAVCLVLFRVSEFERSYDAFHPNADRIYRFVTQKVSEGDIHPTPGLPAPFPVAFRNDFPALKAAAPLYSLPGTEVRPVISEPGVHADPTIYSEELGVFFTDPSLFDIFDSRWLAGGASVLSEPNTVVLDQTHAGKYFGRWENATGRYLKLDNDITLKVAGVIADYPVNSDLPLRVLVSFSTLRLYPQYVRSGLDNWGARTTDFQGFVALPPQVTAEGVNAQLKVFAGKYFNTPGTPGRWTVWLQPLREMHFDNRFWIFSGNTADRGTLWTLNAIGGFILLMAIINFVNLSTARAVGRSKEIGVRKVLGCSRGGIIRQILTETAAIVGVAIGLAAGLAAMVFPMLKQLLDVPAGAPLFTGSSFVYLFACEALVTLLSGLYPAFVLSGFNPLLALRNKVSTSTLGGVTVRRALVIVQFASLQLLLIGTIVVLKQMNYIRNADLGFSKEAILEIPLPNNAGDSNRNAKLRTLKSLLAPLPAIRSTSFCSAAPSAPGAHQTGFMFEHATEYADFALYYKSADPDYFSTFELSFAAGRGYEDGNTDRGIVINETMRKKLHLPDAQSALGRTLRIGMLGGEDAPLIPIVGVVRDFKDRSLYDSVDPIAIFHANPIYEQVDVKLSAADLTKTLPAIRGAWQTVFRDHVFSYSFLDENIARFYRQETQLGSLYQVFTVIAILISGLGLFAVVSFMSIRRLKEMSIRKVLGASAGNVVYLFSRELTILILAAALIAGPCAWLYLRHWLENFAYRIPLNGVVFLLAIAGSLAIAWITIGYHAFRVARVNPAVSLKTE